MGVSASAEYGNIQFRNDTDLWLKWSTTRGVEIGDPSSGVAQPGEVVNIKVGNLQWMGATLSVIVFTGDADPSVWDKWGGLYLGVRHEKSDNQQLVEDTVTVAKQLGIIPGKVEQDSEHEKAREKANRYLYGKERTLHYASGPAILGENDKRTAASRMGIVPNDWRTLTVTGGISPGTPDRELWLHFTK